MTDYEGMDVLKGSPALTPLGNVVHGPSVTVHASSSGPGAGLLAVGGAALGGVGGDRPHRQEGLAVWSREEISSGGL